MPNGAEPGAFWCVKNSLRVICSKPREGAFQISAFKIPSELRTLLLGLSVGGKAAGGLRAGKACGEGVPAGWEAAGGNGVRRLGGPKSSLLIGRFPQKKTPLDRVRTPGFQRQVRSAGEEVQEKGPKSERRDFVGLVCRFVFFFFPHLMPPKVTVFVPFV